MLAFQVKTKIPPAPYAMEIISEINITCKLLKIIVFK